MHTRTKMKAAGRTPRRWRLVIETDGPAIGMMVCPLCGQLCGGGQRKATGDLLRHVLAKHADEALARRIRKGSFRTSHTCPPAGDSAPRRPDRGGHATAFRWPGNP